MDVNLGQRIEYLSRAAMCAKSSTLRTTSAVEGEFLHELEKKMEVGFVGNHELTGVCTHFLWFLWFLSSAISADMTWQVIYASHIRATGYQNTVNI